MASLAKKILSFRQYASLRWNKGKSQKSIRSRYREYLVEAEAQQAQPEPAPAADTGIDAEVEALLPRTRLPEEAARPLLQSYVHARRNLEAALKAARPSDKEATVVAKLGEALGFTNRQVPESGDRIGRLTTLQSIAAARASARWAEAHMAERSEAAALTARLATDGLSDDDAARLAILADALKPDAAEMAGLYRAAFMDVCREWNEEPPPPDDVRWWRPS